MNETSRLAEKMEDLDAKLFKLNEKGKNIESLQPPCITKKRFVISRKSRLYCRSMRNWTKVTRRMIDVDRR